MYLVTRDTDVVVTGVTVTAAEAGQGTGNCDTGGDGGGAETDDESPWSGFVFDDEFGGLSADDATNTFNFPSN